MARRAKGEPSTDAADPLAVPMAIELASVRGASEMIEQLLGVPPSGQAARLADPKLLDEALASTSGVGLAVLEALVDVGGQELREQVVGLVVGRLGVDAERVEHAIGELVRHVLVIELRVALRTGETELVVGIPRERARPIAQRVLGLTRPPATLAPEAIAAQDVDTRADRDQVARLAMTVHGALKLTATRRVNRTSTRKLAVALGLDNDAFADELDAAFSARILRAEGELLTPDVARLRALARREIHLGESPRTAAVRATLPAEGWVSVEHLARAAARRSTLMGRELSGIVAWHRELPLDAAESLRAALASASGLERATVGGALYVRRGRVDESLGGDGHVTPSFEIMLGPRADPDLAAVLALAAEPVRFDHVLTLRLTPASVGAAVGLGLPLEEIERALGAVGRHAPAENVLHSVRDWAKSARSASVRKVWFVEASSVDAAEAAARALGGSVLGRPTPTTLLVDAAAPDPKVALARAGLRTPATGVPEPVAASAAPKSSPLELVSAAPDAALAARFASEKAAGFPVREPVSTTKTLAVETPMDVLARMLPSLGQDAAMIARLLLQLWKTAWPEAATWMNRLPASSRAEALEAMREAPLEWGVWLVLAPKWRSRALRESASFGELVTYCFTHGTAERTSLVGAELEGAIIRSPHAIDELEGASRRARGGVPARGASAPAPREVQAPVSMAPLDRATIEKRFLDAARSGTPVFLRVSSKTKGDRVVRVVPERTLTRGSDVALLGMDAETLEHRSYPLANVVSLAPG